MDTIAATIERLVQAEYGRPAPPHFQRAAAALLRDVCETMQGYLSRATEKGEAPKLSNGFSIHFPIPNWDWETTAAPVLTTKVTHFGKETPLLVSPLPDAFAVDVPRNTYLTLARGAVHRWRDSGPLAAYHLYLTTAQIEELKGLEEESARDFFIKQRYIPARLYETSWTLSANGMDFTRKLTVSLFAIQLQDDKRLAALPVVFYFSSKIREPVWATMERDEMLLPPDLSGEELAEALAKLEAALEGKEPLLAGPQTAEMFPPEAVETTKLPAALRLLPFFLGRPVPSPLRQAQSAHRALLDAMIRSYSAASTHRIPGGSGRACATMLRVSWASSASIRSSSRSILASICRSITTPPIPMPMQSTASIMPTSPIILMPISFQHGG